MGESLRILILEDNPSDAELVQFELAEAGIDFTAKVATTGKEYIQAIQDYCPDLILSDYDLPTYNGALALAEARRRCPDTPFILVTGAVTEDRAIDILTQGAKDYVLKTRLEQRLVPAVQRALEEAEEHRARKEAETELHEAYRTLEDRVKSRTAELEAAMAAQKKTEEALRESERRERERADELAAILDAMPTPVFIVHDPDSTRITGNRTANELLQQPHGAEVSLAAPPEVKPRHFKAVKDGRELRIDELPAQRAARGEYVQDFEFSLAFDDGMRRHVLGYGTPLLDEKQRPRGAVHVLVDITERKRAEETLRDSEERFRSIFRSNVVALAIWDAQGHLLDANDRFLKLIGYTREELDAGQVRWDEATPPEMRQRDDDAVKELQAGKEIEPYEKEFVHPDGTRVPVIIGGGILPGTPDIGVAFAIDITERKLMEEEKERILNDLYEEKDRLQALINGISDEIWFADTQKQFTLANPSALHEFGLNPDANDIDIPRFAESLEVFRPDGSARPVEEAPPLRALKGEVVKDQEEMIRTPATGEIRHRQVSSNPIRDANNQIIGSVSVVRDITERKQAEEALRESEERFRVAQELSPDGFSILRPVRDSEGRIVDFTFVYENAAIARINGTDPAAVVGRRVSEFLPAHSQSPFHEVHAHVADTGETCIMERKYDGGDIPRPTWFRVVVVRTGQDIAILSQDITERKQAEEAMKIQARQTEEANKELESFSYSVSHDLRAPLRAIDGYSRMILRKHADQFDEDAHGKFNVILDNTRMMNQLIDDLLAFSRLGKTQLSVANLDMGVMIREVWEEMRAANPERNLKLTIGAIPPAAGDRGLIRQVLVNLLSNAVKFTRQRPEALIEVGGHLKDSECIYTVRDNGAGFDMQYHDKMFGVFQRLHSAHDFEGTGVGLAIVQRIIHRHGGRVWAEGKLGKGATFYFTLPTPQG